MGFIDYYLLAAKKINQVLEYVCIFCIVIMTLIVWAQVFNRYILGSSFIWVEEVAKVLMVYMAILGSAILVFEDGHVSVTFIIDKLQFKYWIKALFLAFIISFSVVLTYSGVVFASGTVRHSWMTGISYAYYHWSMAIGGFFLVTQSLAQFLKITRDYLLKKGDES